MSLYYVIFNRTFKPVRHHVDNKEPAGDPPTPASVWKHWFDHDKELKRLGSLDDEINLNSRQVYCVALDCVICQKYQGPEVVPPRASRRFVTTPLWGRGDCIPRPAIPALNYAISLKARSAQR
jgi:hypothetical protein